jgi:hypothetical protein
VAITPASDGSLVIDPRHASLFTVDLSTRQTGQTISNGNRNGTAATGQHIYLTRIVVDTQIAKSYPGLEFTVVFSLPSNQRNRACVSVYYDSSLKNDILSPVNGFANYHEQSLILRSTGNNFTVSGSSPMVFTTPNKRVMII